LWWRGRCSPDGLYIPHGSDERINLMVTMPMFSVLYIPHGSDESSFSAEETNTLATFISHMVQMKEKINHLTFKR